jgi:FAD/FMN-containing dehydrogenase
VIEPGDNGYEAARATFNGMLDRRPELITRPIDTDDPVAYATEAGLPVAVRGGGHGVAGHGVGDASVRVEELLVGAVRRVASGRCARP